MSEESIKYSEKKFIKVFLFCYALIFLLILAWGFLPEVGFFRYFSDGFSIRQSAVNAQVRYLLWEEPKKVDASLNKLRNNVESTVSTDGTMIIFSHKFSYKNYDLYYSIFQDGKWKTPKPLNSINSAYNERSPELTKDGQFLYFYSNRPGGLGNNDVWVSRRVGLSWSKPVNLGPEVNTKFDDVDPAVSVDGKFLYISSNRPHQLHVSDKKSESANNETKKNDYDIYKADIKVKGYREPLEYSKIRNMDILNSNYDDGKVALNARGDSLYFNSNRPGYGGYDIYQSKLYLGTYSDPALLKSPINSLYDDISPSLSIDGYVLYISSNRDSRSSLDFTIYQSISREVLVNVDYDMVKNYVLLALMVLILIIVSYYILRLFLGQNDMKTISKCLLASLLLHLLLAALSGTMYLTSEMTDSLDDPEEMTINVNNLARESIAMSIREGVESLPEVTTTNSVSEPTVEVTPQNQQPETTVDVNDTNDSETAVNDASAADVAMAEVVNMMNTEPTVSDITSVEPMIVGSVNTRMEQKAKGGANTTAKQKGHKQGLPSLAKSSSTSSKRSYNKLPKKSSKQPDVKKMIDDALKSSKSDSPNIVKNDNSSLIKKMMGTQSDKDSKNRESGKGNNSKAKSKSIPGAAFASNSFAKSLGMFRFKNFLKMEEKKKKEKEEELILGLLKFDPNIATMEQVNSSNIYLIWDKINSSEKALLSDNQYDFLSFKLLFFEKEFKPKRFNLAELIYENMPKLVIPVDSELDVPESMLE